MLCETRLDGTIDSSEVFPPNFSVYRCDRSIDTESKQKIFKTHGGGVLIAVENTLKSQLVSTGEHYGAEQVCVMLPLKDRNIYLVELYIRPDSPVAVYKANMESLQEIASNLRAEDILIVSGDFNLSNLDWYTDENDDADIAIPISASSEKEIIILDACHEMGLMQINQIGNENGVMLDLIWTNCTDTVNCSENKYHLLKKESHHRAYEIKVSDIESSQSELTSNFSYRDFTNANYEAINEKLNNIDWSNIFSGNVLDSHVNKFYELIHSVISSNVELKTKKISSHPKWFNHDLISLKNRVNKQYKFMTSRSTAEAKSCARDVYCELRKEYKKNARLAYKNYKLEMEQLINEDPQKFFEFVNASNKRNNDLPNEMVLGDKKSGNHREIAQFFATHFAKAYTKPDSSIIEDNSGDEPLLKDLCANFPKIDVTEELVLDAMNNLPNNMVSGPDEIPNFFIKKCLPALLKPITFMLKESLETGFVPEIWKKSFVRPVHKGGLRAKVENYRGVALQCIIPKLLDSIVAKHLNYHMKNIIDDSQHGFVKGRSTITNLAEFTSCAILGMENHIQTDAIYLDIAKAFDSVNIDLLIRKLTIMGLNQQLLRWIESYLHGRQQIVKLNSDMSSPIEVTSGTGQGYPIGATLFLLFIIDLPKHIRDSTLQSFADDTRLWKHIRNYEDCLQLQADLNELVAYFNRNQLKLNVSKTKFITFYRRGMRFNFKYLIGHEQIERVNVIKDLGVILDHKLNFTAHIEYITAKAKSRLAWIKRFGREFEDPWTIKRLFNTFVLPNVEYASQIWNPYTAEKIARVESIQKQFLLFALRRMKWSHRFRKPPYECRLLELQMITLEERRKIAQISLVHNVICGHTSSKYILSKINIITPRHRTRNIDFLSLPIRHRDYSKYETINYMLMTYNEFYKYFVPIKPPNLPNECNVTTIPNCDTYLIDFNTNTNTVKHRVTEYFKRSRTWRE